MGKKQYPYIFDKDRLLDLDIKSVLETVGCEVKGKNIYCPMDHKKPQALKIHEKDNNCHCHNCKLLGDGSTITIVKTVMNMNFVEACKWLSETFNVAEIPNPDYKGDASSYTPRSSTEGFISQKITPRKTEYMSFDKSKPYKRIDIAKYYSMYEKMEDAQKLKMIYTVIYRLAQGTPQKAKFGYYSDRGINPSNRMKAITYLSVKDFPTLTTILKGKFPLNDLERFGIIHGVDSKTPGDFKLNYVTKGGLLLVPSFELYSDMVTGFMARPTHPPKWMKEKKMKEIQISQTHLIKPLPFGLTYGMLSSDVPFVFATEGHPDGLALPKTIQIDNKLYPVYVISTPGTHGYSDEMLGLLKGKTLLLAYDQDEAGRSGANGKLILQSSEGNIEFPDDEAGNMLMQLNQKRLELNRVKFSTIEHDGLIQRLRKAEVCGVSLEWDEAMGGDVNDLEINGNLEAVIEDVIVPTIKEITQ